MDELKPVHWIASSKNDLSLMPQPVRRDVGYALYSTSPRRATNTPTPRC